MKIRSRIFSLILTALFAINFSGPQASGENGSSIYLPVVSNVIPPMRLGPNVSPGATGIVVSPLNPAVVYAGTFGGGIYKTVDGGAIWTPVSMGLPASVHIQSMGIDPVHPERVYAGLYYNDDLNFASGVYRTEDGGLSWTATGRMDNPAAGIYSNHVVVYAIAISSDGNVVYAGTRTKVPNPPDPNHPYGYGGVFKSINFGLTWTLVNNGLPSTDLYVYDLAVDPTDANRVYAGLHGSGVYRTEDGGGSWVSKNQGIEDYVVSTTADRSIVVDPSNAYRILFGTASRSAYTSTDEAENWGKNWMFDVYDFSADPNGGGSVFASQSDGTIYYSSNFGDTWDRRAINATNGFLAAVPGQESMLYAGGTSGGASTKKSLDGGKSFFPVTQGISGFPVTGAVVDSISVSKLYTSLFGWGIMASTDGGVNWVQVNNGLPELNILGMAADPINSNTLYAMTVSNGVYRSTNGGGTWSALTSGYPTTGAALNANRLPYRTGAPLESPSGPVSEENSIFLNANSFAPGMAAAVSPFSSNLVLLGTAGKGVLWLNIATWSATNVSVGSVYTLLFDKSNPNRVWLGGDPTAGSFQVSNNQGKTWTTVPNGLSGRIVYALSQGTLNPNLLLAGTDLGVFLSTDSGQTWLPVGFNALAVRAVAVHPAVPGRMLVATSASIYISDDFGANWRKIYSQLDGFDFLGVTVTPTGPGYFLFYSRYGGLVRISE